MLGNLSVSVAILLSCICWISIHTANAALVAIYNPEPSAKKFYTDDSEDAVMTWLDALQFCQGENTDNMTPATIDSQEENDLVAKYLDSKYISNKWFWLGMTDFGSETRYYWIPSGEAPVFTNWVSPSQLEWRPAYNCATMDALTNGSWFAQYCHIEETEWKPRPLCQIVSEVK